MKAEAKEFIERERMMNEVKEHYIMQGMWNAFELLDTERRSRRSEGRAIAADRADYYEGEYKGFENAVGLLHNNLKALEL